MLFSSTTFLFAFLPLVLITYFIVPRVLKNAVLLIFSLVFYAWGEPVYIVLMLASITVAYVTGIFADKKRKPGCEKTAFYIYAVRSYMEYRTSFVLQVHRFLHCKCQQPV